MPRPRLGRKLAEITPDAATYKRAPWKAAPPSQLEIALAAAITAAAPFVAKMKRKPKAYNALLKAFRRAMRERLRK